MLGSDGSAGGGGVTEVWILATDGRRYRVADQAALNGVWSLPDVAARLAGLASISVDLPGETDVIGAVINGRMVTGVMFVGRP